MSKTSKGAPAARGGGAELTREIQAKIDAAVADEERTGRLRALLAQASRMAGRSPTRAQLDEAVSFIIQYVRHVPAHTEQSLAEARRVGVEADMRTVLEAALRYWAEPFDVIPDHLGLVGILDDAYVSLSLIQKASDNFKARSGHPLMSLDLTGANAGVRQIIGEPAASQLDLYVGNVLGDRSFADLVTQLLGQAQAFGGRPMVVNDPIWGNASVDDIVKTRLGAMGIF